MDEDEKQKKHVPEEFDGNLDCQGYALCCSFNRTGSLLAVGCNDGRIVVWDFATRHVAKTISAHPIQAVTSISWSRKGQQFSLSLSRQQCCNMGCRRGECLIRWIFKAPLMKVQFNPRDDGLLILAPYKHQPILLRVDYASRPKKVVYRYVPTDNEEAEAGVTASFDRKGEHIFTGGARGRITIMKYCKNFSNRRVDNDFNDRQDGSSDESSASPHSEDDSKIFEVVSSFKIQPVGSSLLTIRDIEFAPKDKGYFLVNSTDRMIRLYSCESALAAGIDGECEELRKFHDTVDKSFVRKCCFSGERSALYVCAGSAKQHAIYMWDIQTGTMKKMLEGSSMRGESLLDVQWHPSKPVAVSVAGGLVYIWARAEVENWSAYAPEFQELDENQDYEERESEFDKGDEDEDLKIRPERKIESDDDISINVDKIENEAYMSSDEERQCISPPLEYIPISLEDHEVVDPAAQN